jgi:hypothetical protein
VTFRCRTCGTPLRRHEVGGDCALFLRPTSAYEAELETDASFDPSGPQWLCRYLDGYPCFDCRTVDLTVSDLTQLLACEGRHLPHSDRPCPACGQACRGLLAIECFGVGRPPLAFLKPKFGAPLWARLCVSCARVWLSLHPGDSEARKELAERFPDGGCCPHCGVGRQRVTQVDLPYSGFAGLHDPARSTGVEGLRVVVCDSCGEAPLRLEEPAGGLRPKRRRRST